MTAEVTQRSFLSMQVCVPFNWTDSQVVEYANAENEAGTKLGWLIRHEGDAALNGDRERIACISREGHVHVMLDC